MNITRFTKIPQEELLDSIAKTRLKGYGQPLVYAHSQIELHTDIDPDTLVPAQRYVLQEDFTRIESLYALFLTKGVDLFHLDGGLLFWIQATETGEEEGPIPLIPPVVEMSHEPNGKVVPLINDGMHRVYAAKRLGKTINIIHVNPVPEAYPYYAYALENGWADVMELDELPDNFQKKTYRDPDNYKALFRDFNGIFPGIQKQRKQSNPAHIKA